MKENLLNKIYQNSRMATWNIDNILPSTKSRSLKALIKKQNEDYESVAHECEELAKQNGIELTDIGKISKGMSYMGVKVDTILNTETNHIADMLIKGTTMGVTQIIHELNIKCAPDEVTKLAERLRAKEEAFIESLKEFL